jgi:Fe(3+) dicitrate transport protein
LQTGITGKQVEQVSPFTLRTGLQYEQDKVKASIQYSYVHKQYSDATNAEYTSNAVIGLIPSYSIMDISLSYKLLHSLSADIHIQNVFNELYFTRRAESYPGPGILPSDPRNITCSIQYSL